jgi:hypothetical protein
MKLRKQQKKHPIEKDQIIQITFCLIKSTLWNPLTTDSYSTEIAYEVGL